MTGATLPGSAGPVTTTCGPASATGSTTSSQSSTSTSSQPGVPTIPMGSTELSNPGLSPAPVCGNGQHGGNALQFLLTPMCMMGNDKCDAS
jgi:hypothetical protein